MYHQKKLKSEDYKHCLEAAQKKEKNHLQENKIGVDSPKEFTN